MSMNIGGIILNLRREKGYTQEKLAQLLGVSSAAVSKWETDSAYPDIVLLPQLAGIFDVSLDRLFGYDTVQKKSVPEVINEAARLAKEEKRDEAVSLISKALLRYPNNCALMLELGRHKFMLAQRAADQDAKLAEAAKYFKLVAENTDDDALRQWAYHFLTVISALRAEYDQARAYNRKNLPAKGLDPRSDMFIIEALEDEGAAVQCRSKELMYRSIAEFISVMNFVVSYYLCHGRADDALSEARRTLGVLEHFSDTGLFYDDLSVSYEGAAWACAMKGEWEDCLGYLEKACEYAEKHDAKEGKFEFDILGFEMPELESVSSRSNLLEALQSGERSDYDRIRNDARFKEIIRCLSE